MMSMTTNSDIKKRSIYFRVWLVITTNLERKLPEIFFFQNLMFWIVWKVWNLTLFLQACWLKFSLVEIFEPTITAYTHIIPYSLFLNILLFWSSSYLFIFSIKEWQVEDLLCCGWNKKQESEDCDGWWFTNNSPTVSPVQWVVRRERNTAMLQNT